MLPDTVFESLTVIKSVYVKYINSVNLDDLLKERIKLKSDMFKPQIINGSIVFEKNVLVHGKFLFEICNLNIFMYICVLTLLNLLLSII